MIEHRGCGLCFGDYEPSEKPDPAASLNCDARTGQRIEAKCSQPVARLILNNMTVV